MLLQGGLETQNEMCHANFLYYPYIPLQICTSAPAHVNYIVKQTLKIHKVR